VHRIISEASVRTRQILETNRAVLNDMASALIEYETLDGDKLRELLGRVVKLEVEEVLTSGNGTTPPVTIAPPL
jgi:cell division protease FtsH